MFSIYFIIMDILDIVNKYSSLIIAAAAVITAMATLALAIATIFYIKEIKSERTFRLRRDHTDILKEKIIEPLIEQLKEKGEAKKGFPPFVYTGEDLPVEGETLFNDMENHVDKKLLETYERFKVNCRELSKKIEYLKKNLYKFLKDEYKDKFIFNLWEYFMKENKETRKPGFFSTTYAKPLIGNELGGDTLDFFLDSLLSGCSHVNFYKGTNPVKSQGMSFNTLSFKCKSGEAYGIYVDRNITDEKETEIKNKIEGTLEEAKNEFKNEIVEIDKLIDNINDDKSYVLKNLEELKLIEIYNGKCKFIKFQ